MGKIGSSIVGALFCGAIALAFIAGRDHLDTLWGVQLFVIGAAGVSGIVITLIGMRFRRGARFIFGLGVFQPTDHPWKRLSERSAVEEWTSLGFLESSLNAAWRCSHCPALRFAIYTNDGRPCLVMVNLPREPWTRWTAGLMLVFAKDPPTEFVEP